MFLFKNLQKKFFFETKKTFVSKFRQTKVSHETYDIK